ncbi:MAG TPA: hypothetical protein VLZ06_06220 [Solirubrobacteraceae bacterium]|nr:hypothetical protein [Solirubrobacteraceae bacterium]
MKFLFSRRPLGSLGLGLLMAALAATSAQATVNTEACQTPEYFQAFSYANDSNWYTSVTGDTSDSFTGEGWTLSGGAKIVTTNLSDGATGQVLDLPSGSQAVSPVICVTSLYPNARGIVRNVKGAEGVQFMVEYEGTKTWERAKTTGQIHGSKSDWTLVNAVNIQPGKQSGWQPMRITLVPGGKTSEFQVYDLYIDPRMR